MCGIAGIVSEKIIDLSATAERMATALSHRGPDDAGVWIDQESRVAFGHRRLSIIDLSPLGHQPMVSASGRSVITFNGEIYNYREIRSDLEKSGAKFKSATDTEVVLEAFEKWGMAEALKHFGGMFAFALWDKRDQKLYLARDRLGEKPLYFGWSGSHFAFASELKAIHAIPEFDLRIDEQALQLYFKYNYVPGPYSIWNGIVKLPAGHFVELSIDALKRRSDALSLLNDASVSKRYWTAVEPESVSGTSTDSELIDQLDSVLRKAVSSQLVSDVPLGAFLSGGIDSSLIAAMMVRGGGKVRTFCIGFHEKLYNEAPYAKAIAKHLGTEHSETYLSANDSRGMIPGLVDVYDEPFADSSQIPTLLLTRYTKLQVTVALSGDGGDELFGGYRRYIQGQRLWSLLEKLPSVVKGVAGTILPLFPLSFLARVSRIIPGIDATATARLSHRLAVLPTMIRQKSTEEFYDSLITYWPDSESPLKSPGLTHFRYGGDAWKIRAKFLDQMRLADVHAYLPDDILVKVDRAAMAFGLETRVPFLDSDLVRFSMGLSPTHLVRQGKTKWILRELLSRYVPRQLFERPKRGFSVPLESWLRGPLRGWAEHLFSDRMLQHGLLDGEQIRTKWSEFINGRPWEQLLWNVVVFQAWHERWKRP